LLGYIFNEGKIFLEAATKLHVRCAALQTQVSSLNSLRMFS